MGKKLIFLIFIFIGVFFTNCGGGGNNLDNNSTLINGKFSRDKTIRIMPLGDSITFGYANAYFDSNGNLKVPIGKWTAYRSFLYYDLEDAGVKVDFVGSRRSGYDVIPKFDPDNEGYPGATSWQIANHTYEFLEKNPADVVLLHIGSNDHADGRVDGTEKILNEIKRWGNDHHKHVKVFVALIINRWFWDRTIEKYNNNLKQMLENRNDPDIYIVDMSHLLSPQNGDYLEDYHPNEHGYKKMADKWFVSLMDNLY